jgi:phosphoglycolate phosphatase-like HAD superfamily hydrolase
MIGDHCTDLAAARNAGIRSAYAAYGFGRRGDYKPDVEFASFPELVGYFV